MQRSNVTRNQGLEKVYFDGAESISFEKFSLAMAELKRRIMNEHVDYSKSEVKLASELLDLSDKLQLLFLPQDTPLYSSQQTNEVRVMADCLSFTVQEPLLFAQLPMKYREMYMELRDIVDQNRLLRDKQLQQHINVERYLHVMQYAHRINMTCLLGISGRVRKNLEILAKFNRTISHRFNLMHTYKTDDNVLQVNYVLDYISNLEGDHASFFPRQFIERDGDYGKILMLPSSSPSPPSSATTTTSTTTNCTTMEIENTVPISHLRQFNLL